MVNGSVYDFHLVPSGTGGYRYTNSIAGLMNPNAVGVIGAGVVVHLPALFSELDKLKAAGKA